MKLAVIFYALVAAVASKSVTQNAIDIEDNTAYGYLERVGVPLANKIREFESRIAGGSAASLGQFPYQAGLVIKLSSGDESMCGGVLVNERRVLTAAHCWWDGVSRGIKMTVVLGSTTLLHGGTKQETISVVVHESWDPNLNHNDIAMIRLKNAVEFNKNIRPVVLPYGSLLNENFVGETATASGYGSTGNGPPGSLNWVNLRVIPNNECRKVFPSVQPSNICTSGENGRSTCKGDSGGPIVVTRNGNPILIGLTSFGAESCIIGAPVAFARVTSFHSWIQGLL
ncbi:chymotrypsin-1-like [Anticarsia gemmatalis]|uniref:chymotrypsin-1-like n=1 Tax=Anticarsia gemmatalis TaxID=129554 RepID=UPI003F75C61C